MEYRKLGSAGLRVSEVGLGGNNFGWFIDEARSTLVIQRALDLGVNFIDTADVYDQGSSEQYLGRVLTGRRQQVVLATKTCMPLGQGPNNQGLSYGRIMAACEASLRRLNTDYIDLYYLHFPDLQTPLEETLRAMDDLTRQGKVRYVGVSNHPAWQACEALWISDRRGFRPPGVTQNKYHVLDREVEAELLPLCTAHGLGLVPYSPLANGVLTGKYRAGESNALSSRAERPWARPSFTERNFALVAALDGYARDCGHTVGELAIAWLLAHPEVPSVIAGATSPDQVAANVAAADWKLTAEDMQTIARILEPGED